MSRGIYDMNKVIEWFYNFLWGDLFTLHFGDVSIGIPLLVLLLIPAGIFFTIRTKFMPVRKFPQMIRALSDKNDDKTSLSTFQTLIVSTAARVYCNKSQKRRHNKTGSNRKNIGITGERYIVVVEFDM